jgi:hypothetical protein
LYLASELECVTVALKGGRPVDQNTVDRDQYASDVCTDVGAVALVGIYLALDVYAIKKTARVHDSPRYRMIFLVATCAQSQVDEVASQ